MVVATASKTIKFHNFPNGRVEHYYRPTTTTGSTQQTDGLIRSISWSKDGNWLALVPHSGYAEIISIKNQLKTIYTIESFIEPSCCSFQNTTKKNLIIGTRGGQIYLYDIKSRNIKKTFNKATSMVTHVEFSAKDNYIVASYGNGEANLFSNVTNILVGVLRMPKTHLINTIKTNPIKRNLIVGGSKDGAVTVWDINTNKVRFFNDEMHKAPVCSTIFSPIHSDLFLSTGLDRQFCFYDIGSNKCIKNIFIDNCMLSADFSSDGKYIVMGSQNGKVHIYDSRKLDETIDTFIAHHNSPIKHLVFKRNGGEESDFSITSSIECGVKVENELKLLQQQQLDDESFNLGYISTIESPLSSIKHNDEQNKNATADYDSFMAKIGLDRNKIFESVHVDGDDDDDINKNIQTPLNNNQQQPLSPSSLQLPSHTERLQEKFNVNNNQQYSSTPQELITASPVTTTTASSSSSQSKICKSKGGSGGGLNDVSIYRNIIRDELKTIVDDLKCEIKYKFLDVKDEIRNLHLNQIMVMVKESIKVENAFNNLRNELVNELPQNLAALYEENVLLKQKIASLEERLAMAHLDSNC